MPGYLIKAANFVAEISNDEELKHLAGVETIQKDTLICPLPGKEWIKAKNLPLLRTFWGLDAGTVPPPISKVQTDSIAPIKTKLPPRLDTVVDSTPKFMAAEQASADEGQDLDCADTEKADVRNYQAIASDILSVIEESSEMATRQAMPSSAESSLTCDIDDVQRLVNSAHTWHEPQIVVQPQGVADTVKPDEASEIQELDLGSLSVEIDLEEEDIQDVTACFTGVDATKSLEHAQDVAEEPISALGKDAQAETDASAPISTVIPMLFEVDAASSSVTPSLFEDISEPSDKNSVEPGDKPTFVGPQTDLLARMMQMSDTCNASVADMVKEPPKMSQHDYIEASPNEPTYVIDARDVEVLKNEIKAQHIVAEPSQGASDAINDASDVLENRDNTQDHDDLEGENDEDQTSAFELSKDSEPPHEEAPAVVSSMPVEKTNRSWRDSVAAQMFVPESVPEDLISQFGDWVDEDWEPGDKTQITPSPVHVHAARGKTGDGVESIKPFVPEKKSESIQPYSGAEKASSSDISKGEVSDASNGAAQSRPAEGQASSEASLMRQMEAADTGAWQAREQVAAVQEVVGQKASQSIIEDLKAARAAVEAAKMAAKNNGKFDSSLLDPMMQLVEVLEDAQNSAYGQLSAQDLAAERLQGMSKQQASPVYDVPEDFLDENPSEIFIVKNRKDLLQQLEASAMMERAQKAFEAAPTLRKKPESTAGYKDSLSMIDEESHSDKLKIRGRSELRRMLAAEARAAEMDPVHAIPMVASEDYGESATTQQDQLRSLFEKEGELHLFLANEIKKKASEAELEAVPQVEEDAEAPNPREHSITDDLPRRNAHAVAVAKPRVAEPTVVTGHVVHKSAQAITFEDPFFEGKLMDDESPIAKFDTLYLTTHRIWYIEGDKNNISQYASHDIENIKWVAKNEDKNYIPLMVAIVLAIVGGGGGYGVYVMYPESQLVWGLIAFAIFSLCMVMPLYIICFKKTLQIGLGGDIVLKSNVAITEDNNREGMEFLNQVEKARVIRKRQLEGDKKA